MRRAPSSDSGEVPDLSYFLKLLDTTEPWRLKAKCRDRGFDEFYPERGGSRKTAAAMCKACPVRAECLEYSERNKEPAGMWGGEMRLRHYDKDEEETDGD